MDAPAPADTDEPVAVVTGIEVATLIGHAGELAGFDISPNGRFAVASSDVVASAVKTPGVIADTKGDFFDALSGPLLPVDLFLWDLEKRAKCASLEGCFRPSFSPDGKAVIAISGGDEWAVLWQFASTDATTSTKPVRSGVSAARFTPDGRGTGVGFTGWHSGAGGSDYRPRTASSPARRREGGLGPL